MKFVRNKQPVSILGMTLDNGRFEGAVLRKGRDGIELEAASSQVLDLDPLVDDPELVGREIQQHLEASGIREKSCAFGVPIEWTLTHLVKLPDLDEANLKSFIQLQSEKAFPFPADDLYIAVTRGTDQAQDRYALLTAVPRKHIDLAEKSLQAAGLRPVCLSLGVLALQETVADCGEPLLMLFVQKDKVVMLVRAEGGVACIRSLKEAWSGEPPNRSLNGKALTRELRITLGQLPESTRQSIRRVAACGPPGLMRPLVDELTPRLQALDLQFAQIPDYQPNGTPVHMPIPGTVSPAFALAARYLENPRFTIDFLPPHVSPLAKLVARLASRKFGVLGGVGGVILLITLASFGLQYWTLSRLEEKWDGLEPKVKRLESVQGQIRKFRGWYDRSQPTLRIMQTVTSAFPDDGRVTARNLEIRQPNKVSCSGVTQDKQALLEVLERLRADASVSQLNLEMLRGNSPQQFTFNFIWQEGGDRED